MSRATFDAHRLSFGRSAAHYDEVRPSYPVQAVRWVLGGTPGEAASRVVDLGAGTGKLTRVLLGCCHRVIAVEPDIGMLTRLNRTTPGAAPVAGAAEAIPLADANADAVLAGQAYHWFDQERARAEIARVLRDGGVFAPVWNIRDDAEPWVARLSQLLHPADRGGHGSDRGGPEVNQSGQEAEPGEHASAGYSGHAGRRVGGFGPLFGPVERAVFRHATTHTADSLVALVRSRSYYLTAPPGRRRELEELVRDLAATHPDLRGRASFPLPYLTVAYRAARVLRS